MKNNNFFLKDIILGLILGFVIGMTGLASTSVYFLSLISSNDILDNFYAILSLNTFLILINSIIVISISKLGDTN